jgi:serine/threonine-protein kinase
VSELAKALAYAHTATLPDGSPAAIVHRDVRPENVMISNNGEVVLTDFGIARATFSERTRTGEIKGSAPYMSPEQCHQRDLDGRSDLWSLGILLFELFSGTRPFDGPTHFATQFAVIAGKRPDLRTLAPGLPQELYSLVDQLLELEREHRPSSAVALLGALSEITSVRFDAHLQLAAHVRAIG